MPLPYDEKLFIAALTRYQPSLEAYCYANLGNSVDASEVLQAACVKMWEKAADWDPDTAFLPWAFAVARFTILSHYRDKKRDRLIFDEDVAQAMVQQTEEAATTFEERLEALAICMKKLTEDQLALLHDYYTDNQTVREIAAASGRSLSAVKMTLLRIRQQLATCIDRQLGMTS